METAPAASQDRATDSSRAGSNEGSNGTRKISLNLTDADTDAVGRLSKMTGYNKSDVIRRGIRIQEMLVRHLQESGEVLLRRADGSLERLVLA